MQSDASIMNNYEVLGQVGEGSFGQVYKARKRSNGEIVAFKVIRKASLAFLFVSSARLLFINKHAFPPPGHRNGLIQFVFFSTLQRGRSLKELKSLRQECEIQRRLHHPNIVQMLDSFETENEVTSRNFFAHTAIFNHRLHELTKIFCTTDYRGYRVR